MVHDEPTAAAVQRRLAQRARLVDVAGGLVLDAKGRRLAFASVADAAEVSLSTVTMHWASIDDLLGEIIARAGARHERAIVDASGDARLVAVLSAVREQLHEPVVKACIAQLMLPSGDAAARGLILRVSVFPIETFRSRVGAISASRYLQLMGPLFLCEFLNGAPASDSLLRELGKLWSSWLSQAPGKAYP